MKDYFRQQLSNTELVARLLHTADKDGVYSDRDIYGQGLLDLAAATSPVGEPGVAAGRRVDGAGDSLGRTRLDLGAAFGDGLTRSLARQELAAFDDLGAPFWFSLDGFTGAGRGPSMTARLRGFVAPHPFDGDSGSGGILLGGLALGDRDARPDGPWPGFVEAPSASVHRGHLSLAARASAVGAIRPDGLGFAAFSTEGMRGPAPATGAVVSWRSFDLPVAMHGGLVAERDTLLHSGASGAFGRLSARTAFAGVEGSARAGGWRLGAGAEIGVAQAHARDGMLAGMSPLVSSAFAVRAERPLADRGSLMFSVSQPLRVESGRARLSVPPGRTPDGRVLRRSVAAGLEPSGRQLDVAAQWRRPLPIGGELRLRAAVTRQPGHAAGADTDLSLLAGWHGTF